MMETMKCTASVWPHRHTNELTGPLDVTINSRSQPLLVQRWAKGLSVPIYLEQPDERTNLTILKIYFGGQGVQRTTPHRKRRGGGLKFYLRSRITNLMDHPLPRGKWDGTCVYDDYWCTYTFQAMTMKVQAEESRIIVP
jgi:hypothetical protein